MSHSEFTLAAYYFPNYHPNLRNNLVHGFGWTEWDLIRLARPRFPDHYQPRQPIWGYQDESDPKVMAQKIEAAADHCINVFLYDWYWYDDGPFLDGCLEKGYLQAGNNHRVKFAIHWANHDWYDIHPAKRIECLQQSQKLLYPGKITLGTFDILTDYVIENYFQHPSYWKIDGAPYFSVYDLPNLVSSLGGIEKTSLALEKFRRKTIASGFPDLHLNQVLWNVGVLPGENHIHNHDDLLRELGFNSYTSYVWIHHVPFTHFPETDYLTVADAYIKYWNEKVTSIKLPYFPNITVGWDSSPRTVQSDVFDHAGYPFTPVLYGNTPDNFTKVVLRIKNQIEFLGGPPIVTINAWNEWTEGSYLEPDNRYGYRYLEAIRDSFS